MITGYFRPKNLEDTLKLLEDSRNIPVGGGTSLASIDCDISMVDLQNLGLETISEDEHQICFGAAATLQTLLEYFNDSPAMQEAIKIEASRNQRERVTIAGLTQASNGRSPLLTLLLALNPTMKWQPGDLNISLGEYLAQRKSWCKASLITGYNLDKGVRFSFESIGRSPYDLPIICIALAKWPSGRVRVTAGGFGVLPILVADGNLHDDLELAVENALLSASDEWSSAEYRIAAAKKIVLRLKKEVE